MSEFGAMFLDQAELIALYLLSASFLLTVMRVILGPTLPDRILSLDMLVSVVIGFIAVIGIRSGFTLYIDIAIALGLVGFLATVAFARFVMMRGHIGDDDDAQEQAQETAP
ncbi:cation:proton antiporter [Notoacmeibacter marinus]|nr:cation:proton antiporter [Notoacmeibacter marinus]